MPFAKTQRFCRMVRRLAPTVLAQTRAAILQNFEKILSPKREFFTEPGELEAHVLTVLGESSEEVTQRVSGTPYGTVNDLALYTLGMNVRVAVIPKISRVRSSSIRPRRV